MIKFLFLILLLSLSLPQTNEVKISEITVNGNRLMIEQDIINFSGLSENSYINAIEIQNAINRLWLLNKFSNIQIDLEESNYGLNNLIINVQEHPIINEINFKGKYFNFEFLKFKKSKSELKKITELESGSSLSNQKIKKAIDLLKTDFINRNFHDVKISYTIENTNSDLKQNVTFDINSGKKTKIHDIKVILNGNEIEKINFINMTRNNFNKNKLITKNNILKNLAEINIWKWYKPWNGKYNDLKFLEMEEVLSTYFKYQGYLDFKLNEYKLVKSKNIFNRSKNILYLNITSGNKYSINDINITGNYIFNDSTLKSQIMLTNHDIYDGLKLDLSNMNLTNLYRDKGFLFTAINSSVTPYSDSLLNVNFDINEKSVVYVNKVIIRGNETTKDNVIRRDIDVKPGKIFSQSDIMESYRRLFMLNFFESVNPDIIPIQGKNEVDVVFDVVEKGSGQLNFSAGYSGVLGFTGGGGFSFPNFIGTGQSLSFNYQRGISSQDQSNISINNNSNASANQQFSMSYVEPRLFNTHNLIGFSAQYQERGQSNSQPFDSKIMGFGIRFGRRFDWPDKFFKGTWMLNASQREYFSDNKDDLISYYSSSIEDYIESNGNKFIFPTSGLKITQSISRDNRDHPEFPTTGSKFNWKMTLSGSFLGGSEDYFKNEFGFKLYNEVFKKLVIQQTFKAGFLNPIESTGRSIVPYSARFRMGGALPYGEMLRGYGDNMIGPIGASYPKGGNILLKYSFELRYLVSDNPNMYILCFAEAGNIWDELDVVDPFKLRRSAGLGARVMMPMLGTLGYDIAYGFDSSVEEYLTGKNGAHGWEYHFIFGMPIN
tara:strand:- start:423 stop:2912 length:2490 start_codon:yes stop_codon:yes gene_type:complete